VSESLLNVSNALNNTASVASQTTGYGNPIVDIIVSVLPTIILFFFYFNASKIFGLYHDIRATLLLKKISRKYGKNLIFLYHGGGGMFGDMIMGSTLRKFRKAFSYMEGDVDIVFHSPGGSVFYSMRIATLIKNYKRGKVRAVIPSFAMSGASLLSLACDEIVIDENACLGVIDPQLSLLWKGYSSKAWNHIIEKKGKDASDDAYAMSLTGQMVTKTIRDFIRDLLVNKVPADKIEGFLDLLVQGNVEHSFQLGYAVLKDYGLKVDLLDDGLVDGLVINPPMSEVLFSVRKKDD